MKTIVITGSTRGIGRGIAQAMLERGCQVVINGRSQNSVDATVTELQQQFGSERVVGQASDIGQYEDVQHLWDAAITAFGAVDIWLNNAALSSSEQDFWLHDPETIASVIHTNIVGTMYGCKVAAQGMLKQGHGHIYTVEGWGSGGQIRAGSALYGSSKYALSYFTKTLIRELKDTPVKFSSFSPGMVLTHLFKISVQEGREEQARRFFNILGDRVETVAPWLADKILQNDQHGARIAWLTFPGIVKRFLMSPFRKRDIVGDQSLRDPQPIEHS